MNIKEAYKTLDLSDNASEEDVKKAFKKSAAKLHPDVNKEPDAEANFKKVNEAFQTIQDHKNNPHKYEQQSPFRRTNINIEDFGIDFSDIFQHNNAEQQKSFSYAPLNTRIKISFKESIVGCNKDISYKKYIKCVKCNGKGTEAIGNGCQSCNGFGRITSSNKGMVFTRVCQKCYGRDAKTKPCIPCNQVGVLEVDTNVNVHIPPGTIDDAHLRLRGGGHYAGTAIFGDAYTDVSVFVNVIPEEGLSLIGQNVVSHTKISLLDALIGCEREIKTINDNKTIIIPPLSKNKDEVNIKSCGVPPYGIHNVIVDVEYPDDTNNLIKFLKKKDK